MRSKHNFLRFKNIKSRIISFSAASVLLITGLGGGLVPIINGTVLADDDYNSFSVTSPSHGDNWQGGSTHDITWSSNSHNNVDISYTLDDTASHPIWVSISNNAPSSDSSSNSYAWTLPSESSTYTHAEIEIDLDYSSSKAFSSEFTISPAISKPIVKDVSSSTAFQTPVVINLTSDITGSDITSVNVSTNPGNATAIVSGESVTYTPNNGFTGSDSFYYTATNPGGTSNPAKVSIQVNAPSKPTVSNVYTSTAYQTSLPIDLSSDINGQDITSVNVVYGPNHGTTSVSGETVTYTPSTGFYGNDSFKYTATNPGGTSYQAYVYIDVGQPPAPSVPILTAPGNGSYTNNNKPQLTWDTTSDATSYKVSLSQDASSLGSPLTVYSNSYTPTSALSDGTWYWQVQACNITGCTPSAEWSFTVDTVAPTVTVTPVTGSLLHGTETFDITIHDTNPASSANQADWVYIYNTSTSQDYGQKVDLSSGSGTFVVNTKDLADGTYDLDVGIVYDAAGNPSGRSDNYFSNYTIDNSPPTGLANLSPSNPTYTTTAGLSSVSWTTAYDPDGPVTYYYESSNSDTTNADGSFVAPVYQSGALVSTTSISASGTPEGTYYWHVQACDALGNCTDWTAPWEIIVDNTRPNVSFVTPTDFSGIFTVGPYVTIDASDTGSGLAIMVLHVYNGSNTLLGICGTANSTELALGSMSCDLSGLPSGVYYIKAGANDKAGNNTTISSGDFTIDTIVLTEPTLISPLNNAIVNGTSLTNSWSTVTGAQTYEYESFNTNDSTQPPRFDATYSTTSKTATNVADGTTFYWRVRAIDQYGQVGPWSNGGDLWKVTVDNTAPVVEITAPTSTYVSGTVTISGTVTDTNPDHYYLVVKDSSGTVVAGPGTVYAANVSDYSWDTTSVADGTYTIDLEARDAAGNKDANSVQTKTVIVDNTAPVTPVALPTGGSYTGSQLVTLSSSDAGSGLAAIYYTTDGTTPSNTHGTLYTTAGFLVSSSETVKAVAYDNVGNESGVMSDSYTISAPIVPTFTTFNSVNNTGTGGNTNTGQVLGASTNTPNTNNGNGNNNGHVKGASTTKNKKNTGNFWGLGWWWLLILALILGLLYLLFRRRKDTENA